MQKAAELLNKTELDGREVVVEVAKPSDEKDKERKEKKAKRRPGRRGAKAVPGEVTEAEANGEATKTDAPTTEGETEGVAKPKKKKKSAVCTSIDFFDVQCTYRHAYSASLSSLRLRAMSQNPLRRTLRGLPRQHRRRRDVSASLACPVLKVKTQLGNPPRPCFS